MSLSDTEHRPAGGAERSCAAWSGGRPRRPIAVFRHNVMAAAKPSGNPPSLLPASAHGRSGGSSHHGILWSRGVTPARQRICARSTCIFNVALKLSIVHEKSLFDE